MEALKPAGRADRLQAERHAKERDFHDKLAAELSVRPVSERPPDELETSLFDLAEPLDGKHVLDLGCGTGDVTLQLLAKGAAVTALDISPGMVSLVQRRGAELYPDRDLRVAVAPAEALSLADNTVDLVVGKWILHHVNVRQAAQEIARVLRPGGRGIFIENSDINPLLSFARHHLAGRFGIPRFGTEDEHPLRPTDYNIFADVFDTFRLYYPDFCFFQLFDRQIFRFRSAFLTRLLRKLDDYVWRNLSPLRRYSFHVIIEVAKH